MASKQEWSNHARRLSAALSKARDERDAAQAELAAERERLRLRPRLRLRRRPRLRRRLRRERAVTIEAREVLS